MNVLLCTLALFCMTADQVETSRTADTLLYIRTVPSGAQIFLDGKPLGNSDGLFPVKPGTYKIVVDLEGHEPHKQEISIVDGRIKRIELVLKPVGQEVARPLKQDFGPVIERTVYDDHIGKEWMIDLDSGKLYMPPRELDPEQNSQADVKQLIAWIREKSIDATGINANRGILYGFELVVGVMDTTWENATIQAIEEALKQAPPRGDFSDQDVVSPISLGGRNNPEAVYAFSTREGGTGVLQIVAVTDDGTGARIRYKLVQRSASTTSSESEQPRYMANLSTRTVMLPDVDRRDSPTVLDLASGELIENIARDGDPSGFVRLGKGDLWQDGGYFGTVRNARAMLWDGTTFAPLEAIRSDGVGSTGYGKLTLPCRLLITTAEKTPYDVSILWMDGQGSARIDYRRADPSVVPDNSNTMFAYRKATAELHSIRTALDIYNLDTGQYPTTTQGLEALIKRPVDMKAPGSWHGPYLNLKTNSLFRDPWGHPYQYCYIEKRDMPVVWSKGMDRISETSDDVPPNDMLANRMQSGSHLAAMGKAMLIYANDHNDVLPPHLESLVSEAELHPKYLVSPSKPEGLAGSSYIYVAGQTTNMNPNNVIAYENPAYCQDGLNVLYLDSHVAWEKPDNFLQALAATYKRLERPMQDIQFKNSDNADPSASFNTVFEFVIQDLDEGNGHEAIDLDNAKQYGLSMYQDGQRESNVVYQLVSQSGVDLLADYASNRWALMTSNLVLRRYLPNEFWDRLGPAEIQVLVSLPQETSQGIELLDRSGFQFYILDRGAEAPQTFAFETGDGALGMLQITEFREEPRAIKIRYRIVRRPLE